jgi:NADPH-dependent 2,4-dienoyl-CoA reductase/sulfur reductase-like enzyme
VEVININPRKNVVEIKDNRQLPYDILVMATGTSAIVPDMPGLDLPGVVGRINTLSVALWAGMDLDQIGYLDLAYAPPFSAAWDIIHKAAQALDRSI